MCAHLCMNQTLPKGGKGNDNPISQIDERSKGSGLFIDLKLACAIQIEYQVN